MLARAARRGVTLVALTAVGGCVSIHAPSFMRPAPERQWPATLESAQGLARARQYDTADSLLAAFAAHYPGTPAAFESAYWRALYKMDPLNPHASLPAAVAALDSYIGNVQTQEHAPEAETLRRIAGQIENLNKLAATALASAREQPSQPSASDTGKASAPSSSSASDDEIKRLRDELAKANAELDRIKRRLAQPPGKPPR